jgi:RimJ/RimL family protein N-acetyltransferase
MEEEFEDCLFSHRLCLLPCSTNILDKILEGDDALAAYLNILVPLNWTRVWPDMIQFAKNLIEQNPNNRRWLMYLFIHQGSRALVGAGGFKGMPDTDGSAEVGYEIVEAWRLQGYATEATQLLIEWAFTHPEVQTVHAHTLDEHHPYYDESAIASATVLAKCGLKEIERYRHAEDGPLIRWELAKQAYQR